MGEPDVGEATTSWTCVRVLRCLLPLVCAVLETFALLETFSFSWMQHVPFLASKEHHLSGWNSISSVIRSSLADVSLVVGIKYFVSKGGNYSFASRFLEMYISDPIVIVLMLVGCVPSFSWILCVLVSFYAVQVNQTSHPFLRYVSMISLILPRISGDIFYVAGLIPFLIFMPSHPTTNFRDVSTWQKSRGVRLLCLIFCYASLLYDSTICFVSDAANAEARPSFLMQWYLRIEVDPFVRYPVLAFVNYLPSVIVAGLYVAVFRNRISCSSALSIGTLCLSILQPLADPFSIEIVLLVCVSHPDLEKDLSRVSWWLPMFWVAITLQLGTYHAWLISKTVNPNYLFFSQIFTIVVLSIAVNDICRSATLSSKRAFPMETVIRSVMTL